jgi:putative transcription factor
MKLSCGICGRPDARAVILVEGAKMVACGGCMRTGKVLYRLDEGSEDTDLPAISQKARRSTMEAGEEVIDGFAGAIKKARDKAGLKVEIVAERINERESYLDAIEAGRMVPTIPVARKLEKELGIKLVEKTVQEVTTESKPQSGKFSEPTLGDMIVPGKKKKGK